MYSMFTCFLSEMLVRFSSPNYTVDESGETLEVTLEVVVPHHNISGEYEPAKHSIEVKVTLKTQDGSAKGTLCIVFICCISHDQSIVVACIYGIS